MPNVSRAAAAFHRVGRAEARGARRVAWLMTSASAKPVERCVKTGGHRARLDLQPAMRAMTSMTSTTAAGNSTFRMRGRRTRSSPPGSNAATGAFPRRQVVARPAARVVTPCASCWPAARSTIVIVGRRREPRAPLQLLDLPLSAYWRFEQSPCCLNEIDVEHGKVYVRRINETRHLEEAA